MSFPLVLLLILGLCYPLLGIVTGLCSLVDRWRNKRRSSPVFVPILGPVFLSLWIMLSGHRWYFVPLVWALDPGTLVLLIYTPKLVREWWQTCSYTEILRLHSEKDKQKAILTLHSTGHYCLKKTWRRKPFELGIRSLGEPGEFRETADGYTLTSFHGIQRKLTRSGGSGFLASELKPLAETRSDYSLDGWGFSSRKNR